MKILTSPLITVVSVLFLGVMIWGSDPVPAPKGGWWLVRGTGGGGKGYPLDISFPDEFNGWEVGASGRILHTSNGGESWGTQQSGTTAGLTCVSFADSLHGWIGGEQNVLGRTTDGGLTWQWQRQADGSRRTVMAMSFLNTREGWVADNYSVIFHTSDGGSSWTAQESGTRWAITSLRFLNAQEGWASATNRVVLHTTDGGAKWNVITLDSLRCAKAFTLVYMDVFCCHARVWIGTSSTASNAFEARASIVNTSDAGKSWLCQTYPGVTMFSSIRFVDENEGWAATDKGILHTTDGGELWTMQLPLQHAMFTKMHFVDRAHGWAVTTDGNIYRYRVL